MNYCCKNLLVPACLSLGIQEGDTGNQETMTREELANKVTTIAVGSAMADVANMIDQIGNPEPETINYARSLIAGVAHGY
jgi:hypothetical protein